MPQTVLRILAAPVTISPWCATGSVAGTAVCVSVPKTPQGVFFAISPMGVRPVAAPWSWPGLPAPLLHGDDLGGQDRPAGSGQELAGLRVTDAVAQCAERAGGWVNIRDGPDASQAVADGDPQLAAIRLQGRQQVQALAVPVHGQGHGAVCLGDAVLQLLAGMHRDLIDGKNTVPGLQLRRAAVTTLAIRMPWVSTSRPTASPPGISSRPSAWAVRAASSAKAIKIFRAV